MFFFYTRFKRMCSFFHVYDRAHLILLEGLRAEQMSAKNLKKNFVLISIAASFGENRSAGECCKLGEICRFLSMVNTISQKNVDHLLVFTSSIQEQSRACFLIGCHLIMTYRLNADEVFRIFDGLYGTFEKLNPHDAGLLDCWKALCCAQSLDWIEFPEIIRSTTHYSSSMEMKKVSHHSR